MWGEGTKAAFQRQIVTEIIKRSKNRRETIWREEEDQKEGGGRTKR